MTSDITFRFLFTVYLCYLSSWASPLYSLPSPEIYINNCRALTRAQESSCYLILYICLSFRSHLFSSCNTLALSLQDKAVFKAFMCYWWRIVRLYLDTPAAKYTQQVSILLNSFPNSYQAAYFTSVTILDSRSTSLGALQCCLMEDKAISTHWKPTVCRTLFQMY